MTPKIESLNSKIVDFDSKNNLNFIVHKYIRSGTYGDLYSAYYKNELICIKSIPIFSDPEHVTEWYENLIKFHDDQNCIHHLREIIKYCNEKNDATECESAIAIILNNCVQDNLTILFPLIYATEKVVNQTHVLIRTNENLISHLLNPLALYSKISIFELEQILKQRIDSSSYNVGLPCELIYMEYFRGTLQEEIRASYGGIETRLLFSDSTIKTNVLLSIIAQIIFGLHTMQQKFNFVHGDLHLGNIMWRQVDYNCHISYCLPHDKQYDVPCYGMQIVLIDFGLSRICFNNQNIVLNKDVYDPRFQDGINDNEQDVQTFLCMLCIELFHNRFFLPSLSNQYSEYARALESANKILNLNCEYDRILANILNSEMYTPKNLFQFFNCFSTKRDKNKRIHKIYI